MISPFGVTAIEKIMTIPGLDKIYRMQCSCGYARDYGYMWQTAEREYERHRQRYPHHETDLIVDDAPPLPDIVIQKKLAQGHRRITTLKIEPGLT